MHINIYTNNPPQAREKGEGGTTSLEIISWGEKQGIEQGPKYFQSSLRKHLSSKSIFRPKGIKVFNSKIQNPSLIFSFRFKKFPSPPWLNNLNGPKFSLNRVPIVDFIEMGYVWVIQA